MIKRDYLTEIQAFKTQQTEVYSELWNELILFVIFMMMFYGN